MLVDVEASWWDATVSHHPIDLLAEQARIRMTPPVAAYVESAAGTGLTHRRNVAAFERYALVPAVGVDVSSIDLSTTVPGMDLAHPVVLAPTALHEMYHPGGEAATARAAAATDSLLVLSSDASQTVESSATHLPHGWWAQLGLWNDRQRVRDYAARVEAAGATALVLTLDSPVGGLRYHQRRFMEDLPPGVVRANFTGPADDPDRFRRMQPGVADPSVTWRVIEEFAASTDLPVLGKGIMRGRDAAQAVDAGLAGVIVSNHGGRSLDASVATLEVLPEVVAAVSGRVPVLVDGGVRRGTDVLTALALGARAVLIGRPYVWGLAVDGEAGVRMVVETLVEELRVAMAMCGVTSVRDVPADAVRRRAVDEI